MTMTQPIRILLLVIAILCFAIGLLLDLNVVHGGHILAWGFGGLLAFAAAHLPTNGGQR